VGREYGNGREPECTFRGEVNCRTLDYIWYSSSLLQLTRLPSHLFTLPDLNYNLNTGVKLPTRSFGSDHLPICASFLL
jgi:mRNA deadenylase 3'-5' endonuclease subunit Ccr4